MRRIRTAACLVGLIAAVFPVTQSPAAGDLCGKTTTAPEALYRELAKDSKLREMARSDAYVALEDGRDGTLWTFTLAGHPAHPSAVCRHPVQEGDRLRIEMSVSCRAAEAECERLVNGFEELNQRMLRDIEKQKKK